MANFKETKKHHYLYKTTNTLNNTYYIGIHSTNNLDDNYLGSGTRLWRAIRKHGKENFKKEILEYFDSRKALLQRESEVVNSDLLKEPLCMNLKPGGESCGFCSEEHAYKFHAAGGRAVRRLLSLRHSEKMKTDLEYKSFFRQRIRDSYKNRYGTFKGKTHSDEVKVKIGKTNSIKQKGERNSQYGTCWVTKEGINKKIKKEELDTFTLQGWSKGRFK